MRFRFLIFYSLKKKRNMMMILFIYFKLNEKNCLAELEQSANFVWRSGVDDQIDDWFAVCVNDWNALWSQWWWSDLAQFLQLGDDDCLGLVLLDLSLGKLNDQLAGAAEWLVVQVVGLWQAKAVCVGYYWEKKICKLIKRK